MSRSRGCSSASCTARSVAPTEESLKAIGLPASKEQGANAHTAANLAARDRSTCTVSAWLVTDPGVQLDTVTVTLKEPLVP